jgi:Holliday junction DNA helicase RuvB
LELIVNRAARLLALEIDADGVAEIARRARGTPRIADTALARLEVDAKGLDGFDRRYLTLIAENFSGGPVGIETIAAALGEARDAIEEIVEPYLLQQGFVQRTSRGRMLTGAAYGHLGLPAPAAAPQQGGLFIEGDEP